MTYYLSLLARKDLSNIWEYTLEHWSSELADKYIRLIMDGPYRICKDPYSGKDYSGVREGYKGIKVKSHIVFYQIEKENKLLIARVLHQKMDMSTNHLMKF